MSTEISPLIVRKFGSIALLTLFCNCSFMSALRRRVNKFYSSRIVAMSNWGARLQQSIQQNQHQHYMCIELRMSYLPRPYLTRCCAPEDTITFQSVETICSTFVFLISHQLFGLELRCRLPAFMSSHMFALLPARRLKALADAEAHREFKAFAPRDHTKPSIDRFALFSLSLPQPCKHACMHALARQPVCSPVPPHPPPACSCRARIPARAAAA